MLGGILRGRQKPPGEEGENRSFAHEVSTLIGAASEHHRMSACSLEVLERGGEIRG